MLSGVKPKRWSERESSGLLSILVVGGLGFGLGLGLGLGFGFGFGFGFGLVLGLATKTARP